MPTPRGNWFPIDLGIKQDEDDMANGEVIVVGGIVPVAGTVKEVWVGLDVLPTTGTVAVAKQASTAVSLLSGASCTLTAATTTLVAYTAAAQTLSTSGAALKVAAGDILTATWTLTSITLAATDQSWCCTVMIEPDIW